MNRASIIEQIRQAMRNGKIVNVDTIMASFLCSKRTATEYFNIAITKRTIVEDTWDKDPKELGL